MWLCVQHRAIFHTHVSEWAQFITIPLLMPHNKASGLTTHIMVHCWHLGCLLFLFCDCHITALDPDRLIVCSSHTTANVVHPEVSRVIWHVDACWGLVERSSSLVWLGWTIPTWMLHNHVHYLQRKFKSVSDLWHMIPTVLKALHKCSWQADCISH